MSKARVEVEIEDRNAIEVIQLEGGSLGDVLREVRQLAALGDELQVFERDGEEVIGIEIENRKALALHAHRCRKVRVMVRWNADTKEHHFSPAAHVHRVLLWAIGKKGFNLDDTAKAKANLMLPGADLPLPKDAVIGRFVKYGDCELTLDLTLRDFTNG
ncbi:MAG TPA: hypothetical protein VN975_09645 [Xanthobacteraceae bacterium]|nr:hypothetical protein [Xanthobacteraceae bacterium]